MFELTRSQAERHDVSNSRQGLAFSLYGIRVLHINVLLLYTWGNTSLIFVMLGQEETGCYCQRSRILKGEWETSSMLAETRPWGSKQHRQQDRLDSNSMLWVHRLVGNLYTVYLVYCACTLRSYVIYSNTSLRAKVDTNNQKTKL